MYEEEDQEEEKKKVITVFHFKDGQKLSFKMGDTYALFNGMGMTGKDLNDLKNDLTQFDFAININNVNFISNLKDD